MLWYVAVISTCERVSLHFLGNSGELRMDVYYFHDFASQHVQSKTIIVDALSACPVFKQYKTCNFKCVKLGDYILSFSILIFM